MTVSTTLPTTAQISFSFYVDATRDTILRCGGLADAVTVRGPRGPDIVSELRSHWEGPVLFDCAAYEKSSRSPPIAADWFRAQEHAGADRLLTPGRWIGWDGTTFRESFDIERRLAEPIGATALVAIDHRWLTKDLDQTVSALASADVPVALVLGHRGDPLSPGGAVDGLLSLCRHLDDFLLLRADHGAVGALAFGGTHASLGLRTATRHLYPPDAKGGGGRRDDKSPRVFVPDLLDWFTGLRLDTWAAAGISMRCDLDCCQGEKLNRFFDERRKAEAQRHNETTLAQLANYIINAPQNDRRRLFADLCRRAIDQYDRLGSMAVNPKGQLEAWAMWA